MEIKSDIQKYSTFKKDNISNDDDFENKHQTTRGWYVESLINQATLFWQVAKFEVVTTRKEFEGKRRKTKSNSNDDEDREKENGKKRRDPDNFSFISAKTMIERGADYQMDIIDFQKNCEFTFQNFSTRQINNVKVVVLHNGNLIELVFKERNKPEQTSFAVSIPPGKREDVTLPPITSKQDLNSYNIQNVNMFLYLLSDNEVIFTFPFVWLDPRGAMKPHGILKKSHKRSKQLTNFFKKRDQEEEKKWNEK